MSLSWHIHVPILYIYVSPHNVGSGIQKNMGHGLCSRTSLTICVLRHTMISLANIIVISGNKFKQTCHLITKITLCHELHHELSMNSHNKSVK